MASENSRYLLHGTARREAFSLKDIAAINCFFAEESLPYETFRLAEIVDPGLLRSGALLSCVIASPESIREKQSFLASPCPSADDGVLMCLH